MSTPSHDSGELNKNSFPLKKVLSRSDKGDSSTIRVVSLSLDGAYLAVGFESGLIEVGPTLSPFTKFLTNY